MTTATLAMYPLAELRPAWERLWVAVHERAAWTPAALTWLDDVMAGWRDVDCVVTHACGWPVVNALRDVVDVVGAFAVDVPGAEGHLYRTVLLARDDAPAVDAVAAVNAEDSLSGWISLRAGLAGGGPWPGSVVWTGSHVESLRALRHARADVASIDPLTLHHVRRHHPDLVAGLHVVGAGPLVPSPPIVVPAGTSVERIAELRQAFATALDTHPEIGRELAFTRFVELDRDDYEPVLALLVSR